LAGLRADSGRGQRAGGPSGQRFGLLAGGFVAAASEGRTVHVARVTPPAEWRAIVVLPAEPLATSKARAMLPDCYNRADVVVNIQSAALLGLAFAQSRGDLLRIAMQDVFISLTAPLSANCCLH